MSYLTRDISEFASEDAAYDWAQRNLACVENADGCVYCFRADH